MKALTQISKTAPDIFLNIAVSHLETDSCDTSWALFSLVLPSKKSATWKQRQERYHKHSIWHLCRWTCFMLPTPAHFRVEVSSKTDCPMKAEDCSPSKVKLRLKCWMLKSFPGTPWAPQEHQLLQPQCPSTDATEMVSKHDFIRWYKQ